MRETDGFAFNPANSILRISSLLRNELGSLAVDLEPRVRASPLLYAPGAGIRSLDRGYANNRLAELSTAAYDLECFECSDGWTDKSLEGGFG